MNRNESTTVVWNETRNRQCVVRRRVDMGRLIGVGDVLVFFGAAVCQAVVAAIARQNVLSAVGNTGRKRRLATVCTAQPAGNTVIRLAQRPTMGRRPKLGTFSV